jgi:NADH-quinone oxidoreductase subunit N
LPCAKPSCDRRSGARPVFIAIAAALIFVGLAFKVSAAPFQIWAPDVYQGAPTPVAAFLSAGPKAAAFAVFLRIFVTAFDPIGGRWAPMVWLAALLSMTVGNFAALLQTNIKRMLAYSSIAHAGYVLVALTARSEVGTAAAMFYLAAYALMNIGAFAAVSTLPARAGGRKTSTISPALAASTLSRRRCSPSSCSLIGVPLTGGFFGKFISSRPLWNPTWSGWLAELNSAVAACYTCASW